MRDMVREARGLVHSIFGPAVAPCRALRARAPRASLIYGVAIVLLSWLVTGIGQKYGSYWAALILLSGFVFVAPVLAIVLYSISRQLQRGREPSLSRRIAELRKTAGTVIVFAMALLVVFLV